MESVHVPVRVPPIHRGVSKDVVEMHSGLLDYIHICGDVETQE
jgi:hypothetical protein